MSITLNVGEYGVALNMLANYNLAGATSLSIVVTRPDGAIFSGVPVMGTVPLVTDDMGTFPASQYAVYTFKLGDIAVAGTYIARLIYTDTTKRLVSNPAGFVVNA